MYKLLASVFFNLIASSVFAATPDCQAHQCMAVVDAGSTGSRIHFFQYDENQNHDKINIQEVSNLKIKPGFASLPLSQQKIDDYLNQLFAATTPTTPLPVYFYATAGMRLLPPDEQLQRYKAVRHWFNDKPSLILKDARTISGQDEGVFGWLAVNYDLGSLQNDSNITKTGVMDIGGASVQITFPIENTNQIPAEDIVSLNLYGHSIKLYAHSFLGLGQNLIRAQFNNDENCYPKDFPLQEGKVGQGDANECKAHISQFIHENYQVDAQVTSALNANPQQIWYGLGALSAVPTDPVFSAKNEFNLQTLLEQGDSQVCQQNWFNLNAQYPSHEFLSGYCLYPAYYYALIVHGYGLNPLQPISFNAKIADWTLGVVLNNNKSKV